MKKFIWFLVVAALFTFTACENGADDAEEEPMDSDTTMLEDGMSENSLESGDLRIYPMEGYKQFDNVQLSLVKPEAGAKVNPGKVKFNYNVQNFELGKQTDDAQQMGIANSKDGQHLHVIFDNNPYMAHYKPEFETDVTAGHHVLLTFPSRSYHLSVKDRNAMVLRQFVAGDATADTMDLSQPLMFYSRPKGEYTGKDANKIMLDFYLANTDLTDGHYVVAEINGQPLKITKWQPFIMEGLPDGENTIKLTLYDAQDNIVQNKYNPVTRTITVSGSATASADVMQH